MADPMPFADQHAAWPTGLSALIRLETVNSGTMLVAQRFKLFAIAERRADGFLRSMDPAASYRVNHAPEEFRPVPGTHGRRRTRTGRVLEIGIHGSQTCVIFPDIETGMELIHCQNFWPRCVAGVGFPYVCWKPPARNCRSKI